MKRSALLIFCCLILVLGGGSTLAAVSRPAPAAQPPGPGQPAQPLENGPATAPAPLHTTAPAARVANDPHWSAPNVRANTDPTTYAQQEPSVAVNPLNPLNVVVAQKDERSAPSPGTATKEVWIDTSTDGGQTWPVQTHIPMPNSTLPQQSDPVVTFSDNNTVYVTIIGLSDAGGLGTNATMVAHSTDGGLTWPSPAVYLNQGQGGSDKEWTAVDLNPASPYHRRVYVTWTNFAAGPAFIEKWSSDDGVTWNPPGGSNYVTVSYGAFDGGQFSMPVVLPNGNVLATWNDFSGRLVVGKSTDGGQSFINPNTVAALINNAFPPPGANWRLNTIPATSASPATGTVVSVWADGRNGKSDIYFTRSTDNGTTWSAVARVAHNAAGNSYQVEPWISVAPNGRFDVIWYDNRDFPANINTFHIYATHSTDDGATWTGPDEQVSDAPSDLNVGIPTGSGWNNAAGDYIGVTSLNDVAYAAWTDTRSGTNEDIYTSAYTPPQQGTPTPTVTGTPPTATPSVTPILSSTPTPSNTPTIVVSDTPTPLPATSTATATATATLCALTFNDVPVGSTFYTWIRCLACRGIVGGYPCGGPGEPCPGAYYRPNNNVTRGQVSKIVSESAAFSDPVPSTQQTFEDVPTSGTFWLWVERLAGRGIIGGYPCGGPFEPCVAPGNRPYFRPNNNITRGQLSKITSGAAGWTETPTGQTFEDVAPASTFYLYIARMAVRGIIQGYPCGGPFEPCVAPDNRPYFRPNNPATRGQMAKIAAEAFFPNCQTPARR